MLTELSDLSLYPIYTKKKEARPTEFSDHLPAPLFRKLVILRRH